MGTSLSCLNTWNKRAPGGSLIELDAGKPAKGSLVASLSQGGNISVGSSSITKAGGAPTLSSTPVGAAGTKTEENRISRRHPTYSAKLKEGEVGQSEFEEETDEDVSEEEFDAVSTSDLHRQKIVEFRKSLTKVVKLRTAFFQETVKVTCSRDGTHIEWYKGKKHDTSAVGGQRKAAGQFPIAKIVSLKPKSDNPKALDVSINVPPLQSYSFTFKAREERELWQSRVESLRKYISLK